jgi:hypothetical protein
MHNPSLFNQKPSFIGLMVLRFRGIQGGRLGQYRDLDEGAQDLSFCCGVRKFEFGAGVPMMWGCITNQTM